MSGTTRLRDVVSQGDWPVQPRGIDGISALLAAELTPMTKLKGERDTEFVKRIVAAYFSAKVLP